MTEPQPAPAECTVCHGYDFPTCPNCLGTGQQTQAAAIEDTVRAELDRPGGAHFTRNEIRAVLAELDRARAELARTRDVLKATQQAAAEDPVTCESCGHIESAHDPDGDRDCHASGARVFACSCLYFIPCYPAPAAEGV